MRRNYKVYRTATPLELAGILLASGTFLSFALAGPLMLATYVAGFFVDKSLT